MDWTQGLGRAIRLGSWLGFSGCLLANRYFNYTYGKPCIEGQPAGSLVCGPRNVAALVNAITLAGLACLVLALVCTSLLHRQRTRLRARQQAMRETTSERIKISLTRRVE